MWYDPTMYTVCAMWTLGGQRIKIKDGSVCIKKQFVDWMVREAAIVA